MAGRKIPFPTSRLAFLSIDQVLYQLYLRDVSKTIGAYDFPELFSGCAPRLA